jgi:putative endonuclease
MPSGRSTQSTLRVLDFIKTHLLPQSKLAPHTRTGRRGEEDAYFHLRRLGYIMVARNFRSPRQHGEIDLIAWDKDVLCFIEVKTHVARHKARGNRRRSPQMEAAKSYRTRIYASPPQRFAVALRCDHRVL